MKHLLPLLLLFFFSAAQAQFEMGLHYDCSVPLGTMAQNIQPVNGFAVIGYGRLHFDRKIYVGGEITFGEYAHLTKEETFISPHDASATSTNVDFSSSVCNFHAIVGYDFTRCTAVIPYVVARAGISKFTTSIFIENPDDHYSCHPVDEENLYSDVAFSIGAGAGVKVDASTLFQKWRMGKCYFDFSANYLWGTPLDYVNVKNFPADNTPLSPNAKAVNVEFTDSHSQEIHQHQVAPVYTSTINFLDFKVGIVKTFGGGCSHKAHE